MFHRILALGDVCGKLLTLVGLPGAIAAVALYYSEIGDALSAPTVSAEIQSVSIRCALAMNTALRGQNLQDFANTQCGQGATSVVVPVVLRNEDSISRTLVSVGGTLVLPDALELSRGAIVLTQARLVEEVIKSSLREIQLRPWTPLRLSAGQTLPVTIDLRPFEAENQLPFQTIRDAVTEEPSRLIGARFSVEMFGLFEGLEAQRPLGSCHFEFVLDTVNKARSKKPWLRAITRGCDGSQPG